MNRRYFVEGLIAATAAFALPMVNVAAEGTRSWPFATREASRRFDFDPVGMFPALKTEVSRYRSEHEADLAFKQIAQALHGESLNPPSEEDANFVIEALSDTPVFGDESKAFGVSVESPQFVIPMAELLVRNKTLVHLWSAVAGANSEAVLIDTASVVFERVKDMNANDANLMFHLPRSDEIQGVELTMTDWYMGPPTND